jgi:hypothetical protein
MDGGEIAATVGDFLGFVGALLLAIPFFLGQEPRDSVLLALARRSPDAAVFDSTLQRHVNHIANYWHWEIRAATVGAALIALAFMTRLAVAFIRLFCPGYFY